MYNFLLFILSVFYCTIYICNSNIIVIQGYNVMHYNSVLFYNKYFIYIFYNKMIEYM